MVDRSKQQAFMDSIRDTVLDVTDGLHREDRKYAIMYLKRHVRIDDLHKYAVKNFPRTNIVLGSGTYLPALVVLTRNPITPQAKAKLNSAFERMGISDDKLYYTHLRFVSTKKKQDIRLAILEQLLGILSPIAILSFDDIEVETKAKLVTLPYTPDIVINGTPEQRKELTTVLKNIKPLILR